jgi:hypothetical protein
VPQLDFGTYTVTITATGFKTFSTTDLKIDAGREYTLNPTLEVGGVEEVVTVQAGAILSIRRTRRSAIRSVPDR